MGTRASSRASLFAVITSLALAACGETDDDDVTYGDDIRPLFEDRCVYCHTPGAPYGPGTGQGIDIANPFAEEGVVNAGNFWRGDAHPELPERTVAPGDPEASFLIYKISPPESGYLGDFAGNYMPLKLPPMTAAEVELVVQWVEGGALDDEFFRCQVLYMFMPSRELAAECGVRYFPGVPGKCDSCHFAGTSYPPDLSDPFGPQGLVNVRANYRADMLRVEPGSAERSLLVQKLRLSAEGNLPNSEYGTPMPKPILPLDEEQVELVREWIRTGARP